MKSGRSGNSRLSVVLGLLALFSNSSVLGFTPPPSRPSSTTSTRTTRTTAVAVAASAAGNVENTSWESLVPDTSSGPVRKQVVSEACSKDDSETIIPSKGSTVTIEYTGSLWMSPDDGIGCSIPSWDTSSVVECWLAEQQGLSEILEGPFREHSVDGAKLLDETFFTEGFVGETLGVDNKIRCKKTIMAAKRLRTTLNEYEHGCVFDSSSTKADKSYSFVLGSGKTIRAMELLVSSMRVGEVSRVVARCDYCYGADGYRTSKGDVLVPPFCALQFEVKLLSVE